MRLLALAALLTSCATASTLRERALLASRVHATREEPPASCRRVTELTAPGRDHDDALEELRARTARRGGDWLTLDGSGASREYAGLTDVAGRAFRCFDDPALAALRPTTVVAREAVMVAQTAPARCQTVGEAAASDPQGSYVRAVEQLRREARQRGSNYLFVQRQAGGVSAAMYLCPAL